MINRFIVIDDDLTNNMICRLVIKGVFGEMDIHTFISAEQGLDFIVKEFSDKEDEMQTILFLDINMPAWTGWDFLEHFDKLDEKIKNQLTIYILSSSVDPIDKERAAQNRNVKDYIVKPLLKDMMISIQESGYVKAIRSK